MRDLVYRPQAEAGKISHRDDFELCYLRHQYLRRVDYNPTQEEMQPYLKIVDYMARKTFYTYRYLFNMVGMEFDDVTNIGQVFLVEFVGLFEIGPEKHVDKYEEFLEEFAANKKTRLQVPNAEQLLSKNKATMTMFMKQRMEDLVRICKQKGKNIKGFKVEDLAPFWGDCEPPDDIYKLLEDNEKYGYKKLDLGQFKAIRKRVKPRPKDAEVFKYNGFFHVGVPLEHRNLNQFDLAGAGLDPYESYHNQDPETILRKKQDEIKFDKKRKVFKNKPKEFRAKILMGFIEKNEEDPKFFDEIKIAKRFLKNMGVEYVRHTTA